MPPLPSHPPCRLTPPLVITPLPLSRSMSHFALAHICAVTHPTGPMSLPRLTTPCIKSMQFLVVGPPPAEFHGCPPYGTTLVKETITSVDAGVASGTTPRSEHLNN